MSLTRVFALSAAVAAFASVAVSAPAQQVYTAKDYAQAERWLYYNVIELSKHGFYKPKYLPDGRVYFTDTTGDARRYTVVDPTTGAMSPAFDSAKLAAALSVASGKKVEPAKLGVTEYEGESTGFAVTTVNGKFHCDALGEKCTVEPGVKATGGRRRGGSTVNLAPGGKVGVFIRENNLWLRTIATGAEKQLTTNGVKDFGYATDNAGWTHSDGAVATWSADGKKIATFQMDERKTGMMYLVPTTNRHPVLEAWHYPLVGDKDVTTVQPVVIDVASGLVTRLKTAPLEHRSMECDDISCEGGKWTDVEFSPDDARLAFVATSRDHKDEDVKVADTTTGEVKQVYHEHVDTYYGWQSRTDWKVLWGSNEFLWVSERSNWAQIYLYDLTTGKLKNELTHGEGPVQDIPYVDEKARVVYFLADGKEKGENPYYDHYYRVGMDGKGQTLLTPEVADHSITPSPDGKTFLDMYSTPVQPETAVLRGANGTLRTTIATPVKQDLEQLQAGGWKPPTPITVKARDGKTDLYGLMFKPTSFDPTKKYPVVDYVYPGPQGGSCEGQTFLAAHGDDQALADLGFVVVCINGMGNPHRSKAFHDAHASKPEEMGDDTIPDQVSGIKDLAARYPWVDATRVGIWGHSGGGNATVSAMFHFPDFFKVGWSESGNHDNRDYEDDWDERWAGLEVIGKDGKSNYDAHANQNYAANLKGKLMLVHGTMDDNVPPNNTLLVADALIKAGKDFDMLMLPNMHHGYGVDSQYIMRRRWDYFVKWLAGGVPPVEYKLATQEEIQKKFAAGPGDEE